MKDVAGMVSRPRPAGLSPGAESLSSEPWGAPGGLCTGSAVHSGLIGDGREQRDRRPGRRLGSERLSSQPILPPFSEVA